MQIRKCRGVGEILDTAFEKTAAGPVGEFVKNKGMNPVSTQPDAPGMQAKPQAPQAQRPVPPQKPALQQRQQKLWQAKWKASEKLLTEQIEAMQKSVKLLLASPMISKNANLVAFLNNYGGMLNADAIAKNPQTLNQLKAATGELSKQIGNFYSSWSQVVQKSQASIAQTMQQIYQFNQTIGALSAFAPQAVAPGAPAAPGQGMGGLGAAFM